MCLYAWRTPACAEWRIWTFPDNASMMEGCTERRGVFLLGLSFSLPAGPQASPRVYHLDQCRRVKTPHRPVGTYSNTRLGLKLEMNPCITHQTLSHLGGIHSPGALTLQFISRGQVLASSLTHTHRAAGKQPVDRKSSLSNTDKTMTSESWPTNQSTPQRETYTH